MAQLGKERCVEGKPTGLNLDICEIGREDRTMGSSSAEASDISTGLWLELLCLDSELKLSSH